MRTIEGSQILCIVRMTMLTMRLKHQSNHSKEQVLGIQRHMEIPFTLYLIIQKMNTGKREKEARTRHPSLEEPS